MTDAGSENESAMPVETRAIIADLRRVRDRPPPADPSSGGCVVAIVAIVTAVLIPFIGLALSLSGGAMLGIGLGLGAIAVAGILLGAFGCCDFRDAVTLGSKINLHRPLWERLANGGPGYVDRSIGPIPEPLA